MFRGRGRGKRGGEKGGLDFKDIRHIKCRHSVHEISLCFTSKAV